MKGAFTRGDEQREALIADANSTAEKTMHWLTPNAQNDGVRDAGEEYGFHPAFTSLMTSLAGDVRQTESKAFVTQVLQSIAPGADTVDVVRQWFLDIWHNGTVGIAAYLDSTPALAPSAAAVQLVEESRHRAVTAAAWRAARAPIGNIQGLSPDVAESAAVILAMSWNLDNVPGAAGDVVSARTSAIRRRSWRASGWTDSLREEMEACTVLLHEQARAAADDTDNETLRRTFMEQYQKLGAAMPRFVELSAHAQRSNAQAYEDMSAWLAEGRRALVAIAGAARCSQKT